MPGKVKQTGRGYNSLYGLNEPGYIHSSSFPVGSGFGETNSTLRVSSSGHGTVGYGYGQNVSAGQAHYSLPGGGKQRSRKQQKVSGDRHLDGQAARKQQKVDGQDARKQQKVSGQDARKQQKVDGQDARRQQKVSGVGKVDGQDKQRQRGQEDDESLFGQLFSFFTGEQSGGDYDDPEVLEQLLDELDEEYYLDEEDQDGGSPYPWEYYNPTTTYGSVGQYANGAPVWGPSGRTV